MNAVINQILTLLENEEGISIAFIYGSFAKGCEHKSSDVDIAVAGETCLDLRYMEQLKNKISDCLNRDIDLVDLNRINGVILREAMKGNLLFCKSSMLKEQLMKKLVYDQEDFMPLRRKMMQRRRMLELQNHE